MPILSGGSFYTHYGDLFAWLSCGLALLGLAGGLVIGTTVTKMSDSSLKTPETAFKCGYVALCGAPNVGKSTLLNRLVADKVAITSPKPQTTRHRLLGVVNLPRAQILFLDAPGLMDPKGLLNENLVKAAVSALNDADVVVWLVTPQEQASEQEAVLAQLRLIYQAADHCHQQDRHPAQAADLAASWNNTTPSGRRRRWCP